MATEYLLTNIGRPLNEENFNSWRIRMTSTLSALGLGIYLEQNVATDDIQDQNEVARIEREKNAAKSILLNNIEDKIYPLITETDSAHDLMENLKILFEKDESVTLQEWLEKLKLLKVKNQRDLLKVTSKMMTIFRKMEIRNMPITEKEKVNYLLKCMPKDLKLIFISSRTDTAENLFDDIKEKYNLLFHIGSAVENRNNNNEHEEMMDIDLVDNILNINKTRNNHKKYCQICKMNNHNIDECYYNLKNKNRNIKNNNNNKRSNFKRNNQFKNKKNRINFVNKNKHDIIYSSDDDLLLIYNIENKEEDNNSKFTTWIYDTGASEHITNNKNILRNFKQFKTKMKCANNTNCEFLGYGTYEGKINNHHIRLNKVYYSKQISKNLISGTKLAESGITCEINNNSHHPQLIIKNNNENIYNTHLNKHNNFRIKTVNKKFSQDKNILNLNKNFQNNIWHNRLGHYYNKNLNKFLRLHKINSKNFNHQNCKFCEIAKLNRKPHNGIPPKANNINEIIYSDIMGPINESINKNKYIITFIDDFSRKAWISPLKSKSDAKEVIINFIKLINNQNPNNKIKVFKSDNGKEYNNKRINNFCKRNGIKKVYSPPYNPQNNGIAERFNRTISACIKTMLFWAKLNTNFWDYAAKQATYIYNLVPHSSINDQVPDEIYFNKTVNLKYLKTFGCLAYYKDFSQNKPKFEINSRKGIYLGFNTKTHCHIIMDEEDKSIHLVREAIFLEEETGNRSKNFGNELADSEIDELLKNHSTMNLNQDHESSGDEFESHHTQNLISINNNNNLINHVTHKNFLNNSNLYNNSHYEIDDNNNNNNSPKENDENIQNNIQSYKRPLSPNNDNHISKYRLLENNENKINSEDIEEIQNDIIFNIDQKQQENINETNNEEEEINNKKKVMKINTEVPLSYSDALNREDWKLWKNAINKELRNLYNNKVMKFIRNIPDNKNLIKTKWVFAIKKDSNNKIIKYKARLVAKGYKQTYGIDYDIIYSPTLDIVCIRLIIAFAAKYKWIIYQLDIQAAYLNAPIDKEVYVTIPKGDANYGNGFWLLQKSLYGLKQSGRNWNNTISSFLIKKGFKQTKAESCLFFKKDLNNKLSCIIGLYVDDIIITGHTYEILEFVSFIKNKFSISKCEPANFILGIKIEKNDDFNYSISQEAFIHNILSKFKITNIQKSKSPYSGDNTNNKNNSPFSKTIYKSAIGSLIHLAKCTRPDIAFAVNNAARNCESPTISDWNKVLTIFKYLNYSINFKITYTGEGNLIAYSDADFGGDKSDRKSTSGNLICIGNKPIFWSSKKQTVVALSTAEAEFISTAELTRKILWIKNILVELLDKDKPITIFTDNKPSKITIENGQFNNNMKHIDIRQHFIFDAYKNNKIKLEYISTENMLADILTKGFSGPKMSKFTNLIFDK